MKKTFIIPALAVTAALVLAITTSAFTSGPKKEYKEKEKYTTRYFQFSGEDIESQYEDSTKWTVLASPPGTDPCPGEVYVCVMQTDDLAAGTRTALVTYLNGLASAQTYCNNSNRVVWKRTDP